MSQPLILASGSTIRLRLLEQANVPVSVEVPRVDEHATKDALTDIRAPARDIADALAEMKARKVASKRPDAMVLGCDQVLVFQGELMSKPGSPDEVVANLRQMRGKPHQLLSAAVIYDQAEPVWRHISTVRLQMRALSDAYIEDYVARNWKSIKNAVGGYKLEEEGARLFVQVQGDYFAVLGMPLLEILNYLTLKGVLKS